MSKAKPLRRTALSHETIWCFEATLEAFGITMRAPKRPGERFGGQLFHETKDYLLRAGYRLAEVNFWGRDGNGWPTLDTPTLTRFLADHPEGDYIIRTNGHVMALRDGQLTDTDTAATGRRRVNFAYTVTVPSREDGR